MIGGGALLVVIGVVTLAVMLSRHPSAGPAAVARAGPPPGSTDPATWKPHPATKPPPELRPSGDDPESSRVYLSDLEEISVRPAPILWTFGKWGHMGTPWKDTRIKANGWVSEKGLSTHPTEKYSGAKYRIGPAEMFEAWVGLADTSNGCGADIVFEVYGDDKLLWKSRPAHQPGHYEECRISVKGVNILEIRVNPPPGLILPPDGAHAVWLDPYVTRPTS
jgi:hypothetical protein